MKTSELSSREAHFDLPCGLWRLLEKSPHPAWLLRSDGCALAFNVAFHEHTGLSGEQAAGFGWLSCLQAADVTATPLHWRRVLALASEQVFPLQLRERTGEMVPLVATVCPLNDGSARWWVVAELAACQPQRGRKSTRMPSIAGAEPPRLDSVHALLFEQSFEPQFVWSRSDGAEPPRITHWNGAATQLYGFELKEALGCDPRALLGTSSPEEMALVDTALDATGQWHGELHQHTAGGSELVVVTAMCVLCDAAGCELVLESGRNVTAERAHAQAQREAETRLRLALAAGAAGIWEWRLDASRTVHCSAEVLAILGVSAAGAELTRARLAEYVHPEDRARVFAGADMAAESSDSLEVAFRLLRGRGEEQRWLHNRALVERDARGRVLRLVGILRDITEERSLSQRALTSESAYRELANALPQYIWTADAAGNVLWVNEHWRVLSGVALEQSLGRGICSLVHPDDRVRVEMQSAEALRAAVPYEIEFRLRLRDGSLRWLLSQVMPIRSAAGEVIRWVGVALDIDARRKAEDTQRDLEHKWSRVFHLNPRPTAISRFHDGVFLDVNDAFLQMSGFTREELIGRSGPEVGAWDPLEQRAVLVAEIPQRGGREHEISFRTRPGKVLRLSVSSARFETAGQACLLHVVSDVTERHSAAEALKESEARARANAAELAALMDAVPASVWIARDRACLNVQGNRAAHEMLRVRQGLNLSKSASDPAVTRHFEVFVNGRLLQADELPLQRAAREGAAVRDFEEEVRFDNGDSMCLYGSAVPLRDELGAVRGAIAAFTDVTRIKQAEAVLRAADRRKDEFLAMLSHELRNPLAPIVTALQLMELSGDRAHARERDVIMRQARHLTRLVDDLLDVSRIAHGKIELDRKPVELAPIVAKALEATAPLFEERQHQLEVSVPVRGLLVQGDEVRLTQIISNLLTNAARYTPVAGHIRLSAAPEGANALLRVCDDGVGIEPELMVSMFELFVQGARGPDRPGSGLGLGLALVRALTTLHGGSVEAHSPGPGQGSEFEVRLPLAAAHESISPSVQRPTMVRSVSRHARKVLLVDDNEDAAEMLCAVLRAAGHEVHVANDPVEALALFEHARFDAALLDIGLPVMDGYELGRMLRARAPSEAQPVLFAVTGYGQQHDRQRSADAGFAVHLVKPVNTAELLRQLDAMPTMSSCE